jgi:hypothetical protein
MGSFTDRALDKMIPKSAFEMKSMRERLVRTTKLETGQEPISEEGRRLQNALKSTD